MNKICSCGERMANCSQNQKGESMEDMLYPNDGEENENSLYQIDEEYYCLCPDEKALEQFAKDGQWDDIEDLEGETGVSREELIGKWFLIINRRIFIK